MTSVLKVACLAIYLLAVLAAFGVLPAGVGHVLQLLACALVAAHLLELLVVFGRVRAHPGPLVDSLALALLFGFLHWRPLARRG